MLIDGTEPVSEPDKKLARYITEQFKPVLLVINKWDLARKLREAPQGPDEDGGLHDDSTSWRNFANISIEELQHVDYRPDRIRLRQGREKRSSRHRRRRNIYSTRPTPG